MLLPFFANEGVSSTFIDGYGDKRHLNEAGQKYVDSLGAFIGDIHNMDDFRLKIHEVHEMPGITDGGKATYLFFMCKRVSRKFSQQWPYYLKLAMSAKKIKPLPISFEVGLDALKAGIQSIDKDVLPSREAIEEWPRMVHHLFRDWLVSYVNLIPPSPLAAVVLPPLDPVTDGSSKVSVSALLCNDDAEAVPAASVDEPEPMTPVDWELVSNPYPMLAIPVSPDDALVPSPAGDAPTDDFDLFAAQHSLSRAPSPAAPATPEHPWAPQSPQGDSPENGLLG